MTKIAEQTSKQSGGSSISLKVLNTNFDARLDKKIKWSPSKEYFTKMNICAGKSQQKNLFEKEKIKDNNFLTDLIR